VAVEAFGGVVGTQQTVALLVHEHAQPTTLRLDGCSELLLPFLALTLLQLVVQLLRGEVAPCASLAHSTSFSPPSVLVSYNVGYVTGIARAPKAIFNLRILGRGISKIFIPLYLLYIPHIPYKANADPYL
jgi:hypothetical protein